MERLDVQFMGIAKQKNEYHNLYFVAFGTQVQVFEPVFPFQKLTNKPMLVLNPPMTRPNAQGFIDRNPANRHAINHLIVGDLGNDEILLLCTDSGNVAAYSTRSIKTAIDRKTADKWVFIDDGGVRAFFSQAVDKSAWGLAVHKTARLIAVSCNASDPDDDEHMNASVTVFAFSLVKPGSGNDATEAVATEEDNFDDVQLQEWFPKTGTLDPKDRGKNITIYRAYHESNIPSIAFLNNGVDPYGEWILSTDIDGKMLLTKVFDDSFGFMEYCFGKPLEQRRIHRRSNQRQMGWSVTALDENFFHEAAAPREFMGTEDWHVKQWSNNLGGDDLNLNRIGVKDVIKISGAELSHMVATPSGESRYSSSEQDLLEFATELSEDEDQDQGMSLLSDLESDLDENEDEHISDGAEAFEFERTGEIGSERLPELGEGISSFTADQTLMAISAAEQDAPPTVTYQSSNEDDEPPNGSSESNAESFLSSNTYDAESQPSLTGDDQMEISEAHDDPSKAGSPDNSATEKDVDVRSLPVKFPILHTTSEQIRLINAPLKPHEHFRLDNPFQHFYDHNETQHLPFDRMNMTSYIPELGVVVIASQMGQVALLVLTRDPFGNTGFRMECALPTQQHAEHDDDLLYMSGPFAYHYPLIGIATAPLQETEFRPGQSPSPSDDIWNTDREDIASVTVMDGADRSYEPRIVRLPSTSRMPRDEPVLQTVPSITEDVPTGSFARGFSSGGFGERDSELDKKTSRRYRLMLYFYNHTIFSYEFGWS
ncbi:MAG: hypothetical protein Q9160_009147 [Pyrenula sp. 1 TL-2023]